MSIIGIVCLISFIGKNLMQYFLDSYSTTNKTDIPNTRARIFLPYTYTIASKFRKYKILCNILYFTFLITAILYVITWNFNK